MADVRGPLALVTVGLGAFAATAYRDLPPTLWVPDLLVGVAALVLAVASRHTSRAVSVLALVTAATWWVGTLWPFALYWHRGVLVHLVLSVPGACPRSRPARIAVVVG